MVFWDLAIKGVALKSWGKASVSAKNIVRDYMEHNWPSLRLAENGWKLEHLASLDYPGWMRTNLNENVTVDDPHTPSNAEDLGNEAEELYKISLEPPELAASPSALILTPPSGMPSFPSTPKMTETLVETSLSPASELPSPPSGLPASTTSTPNVDLECETISPEPSGELTKETSKSPSISSAPPKSDYSQAEVEGSASTAASESPADRIAVNPLGMLSQSNLKIKLPALPPPARAEEVGKSVNTSAKPKQKMQPPRHRICSLCLALVDPGEDKGNKQRIPGLLEDSPQ
ncbi:hypothetical protein J3R82DRAFT_5038 [Butyriboletus roseoflavus]|nr:hypothetical protein J3R82DRAFT_5038 [Butyriboletus roseoflavus]